MDAHLNAITNAYTKYSVTPNAENLKALEELTGRKDLAEILDATDSIVKEAYDLKGLEKLQAAIVDWIMNVALFWIDASKTRRADVSMGAW